MKEGNQMVFWLALLGSLCSQAATGSDEFGRLFTTPKQRAHMDELRKAEPDMEFQIDEQIVDIDEEVEVVEETPVNALTVRGLVYRSNGKNTAWINDTNTFEGNVSSQYINVKDIDPDNVKIEVPSANTVVNLNVGQTFDPVSENYNDLVEESEARIGEVDSTNKRPTSSRPRE
jgi:hypothetical protein